LHNQNQIKLNKIYFITN